MYGNIISAAMQFLTPETIAKIASASGIPDRNMAQKGVTAAVPTIFSGLATLTAKPDAMRQLADTIAEQPHSTAQDFSAMNSGQLLNIGSSALASLFGNSALDTLVKTLGKYVGVGEGPIRSMMSMIMPGILAALGQEAGPGTRGLAQLLTSQKDNFAAAMPAGLSDLLRQSGVLERADAASAEANKAGGSYRAMQDRVETMARAASRTSPPPSANWMYWALPLLALLGLAWYFLGRDVTAPSGSDMPPQSKVTVAPTAQLSDISASLPPQVTSAINALTAALQGVRDGRSVEEVLPKLREVTAEFDRVSSIVNRLPLESREKLAESVKAGIARVKASLSDVDAMPGTGPDAKRALEVLRTKLDALAMTPASLTQRKIGIAGGTVVYLVRSPTGFASIRTYFDRSVHNATGERVGVVKDVILDGDNRITAIVIGVGEFLGIGEKEVAVPISSLQIVRGANDWHLSMEASKDALKDAPSYEDAGSRATPKVNRQ